MKIAISPSLEVIPRKLSVAHGRRIYPPGFARAGVLGGVEHQLPALAEDNPNQSTEPLVKEPEQPTPPRLVKAKLTCRSCGVVVERTLSLLAGAEPPQYFECAKCTGNRSMFDGLSLDEILDLAARNWVARYALIAELSGYEEYATRRHPMLGHGAEFEYRNGYEIYKAARTRRASKRWREQNPVRAREYKKHYRSGFRVREWFEKVEREFDWRCAFCGCELSPETVRCFRPVPLKEGGPADLDNSTPACRSCLGRESAKRLWMKVAEAKEVTSRPVEEEPTSNLLFASQEWPTPPREERISIDPLIDLAKKVNRRGGMASPYH